MGEGGDAVVRSSGHSLQKPWCAKAQAPASCLTSDEHEQVYTSVR